MLYFKINQDLYFIKDNPKKILYIWNKNYKLATPDSHSETGPGLGRLGLGQTVSFEPMTK